MRPPYSPARHAAARAAVLSRLPPGEAVLLFGGSVQRRNADSEFRYRPHSDVLFLTGWEDPEAVVLLRSGVEKPFSMFVQARDPEKEVWDGHRPGPEGAREIWGADEAWPLEALDKELPTLLLGIRVLHYRFAEDPERDRRVSRAIAVAARKARMEAFTHVPRTLVDPEQVLHEARLHKTPEEIELLRRAAAITREAHVAAMRLTAPGVYEYELEAEIEAIFRRSGGEGPGYPSIVGGGANATILHYRANRDPLRAGDLVCVDAGCEYGWYTADVTRTWPVSGRYSPAQRELYEAVLAAQKAAVAAVRPGITWKELRDLSTRMLVEAMVRLGLLDGEPAALIEEKKHKKYYMHGIGHYLGMDVHDVGAYLLDGESRPLAAGMVITIEPGIYVRPDDTDAPERFRGLGIRIEDDVLVTAEGHEVLTADIPKEIADIEAVMAGDAALRPVTSSSTAPAPHAPAGR